MKDGAPKYKDVPLSIVGSTKFGRFAKISVEQTYNMIISDQFLVPFAGYKRIDVIDDTGEGRGIYSSQRLNQMFLVIDDNAYQYDSTLTRQFIGKLSTSIGDVYIAENNNAQIVFSDNLNLYVWDQSGSSPTWNVLTPAILGFTPGYITFQNTRIISPNTTSSLWRLSMLNQALTWPTGSQYEGALQTKPSLAVATVRFPGRGNLLLVFGETVTELWNDIGAALFPYQRNQSINLDYGCLSASTIAESENIVCWLAANEKSGPTIMYTTGGDLQKISTDGIDYRLAQLTDPQNSYGFMLKQDGHLLYVITFVTDNVTYTYDFNTQQFFTLTDENMNAFIVKRVAFFNDQYYFVSIKDGNLYQMGTQFLNYDYGDGYVFEVPRVRITPHLTMPDQSRFVAGYTGFTVEQGQFEFPNRDTRFNLNTQNFNQITTQGGLIISGGQDFTNYAPKINLCTSKDGGVNFGMRYPKFINPLGKRANRLMWWQLGACNDLVQMFEFHGFNRFVASDGITGVFQ